MCTFLSDRRTIKTGNYFRKLPQLGLDAYGTRDCIYPLKNCTADQCARSPGTAMHFDLAVGCLILILSFFGSSLNIWRWCVSSILWCNWLRLIVICSFTKQQGVCVNGLKKGTICWCNQSLSRECYCAVASLVRIPHCTMLFIKTIRKKEIYVYFFLSFIINYI